MANVENIVKIMNFHSLVRIEKSKEEAEKHFAVEQQLTNMIAQILYNKNLNIDKKIIRENQKGMILNIYIGNDLGFCGNFNSVINVELKKDLEAKKIIIGKKINNEDPNVILNITKEDFYKEFKSVEEIIYEYIKNKKIKELNVIYNRYYNVNDIRFEKKRIFPIDINETDINIEVDYTIETDIANVLNSMISLYLTYEIKILEINSWASENVMRERVTRESIKKIEEFSEEKAKSERKQKKLESFRKQLNNYRVGEESI